MQSLPKWVIEQTLDTSRFSCCGNEWLSAIKCEFCYHVMVVCCECDTLYTALPDPTITTIPDWNNWHCPRCNAKLDTSFTSSNRSRITFDEWSSAGLDSFLASKPLDELLSVLVDSTTELHGYIRQNMRSTAKRLTQHLNELADSLIDLVPGAQEARQHARNSVVGGNRVEALLNCDRIGAPVLRAYAIIGIADTLPESDGRSG